MKGMEAIVAWVCACTVFLTGCYSSTMIDPSGDEKENIYAEAIESLVTKDGTAYEFDTPPAVVNERIVGEARARVDETIVRQQVSIPLSDVANLNVRKFEILATVAGTTLLVLGTFAGVLLVGSLIVAIGPHGD